MSPQIIVMSRPECHLCEQATRLLSEFCEPLGLSFEVRNIELDDDLHRRYLERIPVLLIDGIERAELLWDQRAVATLIEQSAKSEAGAS